MTDPQPPAPPVTSPVDPPKPPDNPVVPPVMDASAWETEKAAFQAQIDALTKDNKGSKDLITQLSKILNPDAKPDPDKLAAQLEERDKTLKQRTMELAIVRHAGESAEQLLDSRSFMDKAHALDTNDPNYNDKVKDLVKKHAAPKPPAKSGGADLNGSGGNNGQKQWTQDDLERNKDNPAAIMEAQKNGLLDAILGRVS